MIKKMIPEMIKKMKMIKYMIKKYECNANQNDEKK